VGETHGNGASKKLSALEGPNGSTPAGSAGSRGAACVGGGHKGVPLPTATQLEPLRGCDPDRDTGYSVGLLLNFGSERLQYKRFVF
jgi:hypothetical protein